MIVGVALIVTMRQYCTSGNDGILTAFLPSTVCVARRLGTHASRGQRVRARKTAFVRLGESVDANVSSPYEAAIERCAPGPYLNDMRNHQGCDKDTRSQTRTPIDCCFAFRRASIANF